MPKKRIRTPEETLREQVRAHRERRGWSQERLAEEVTALGVPMTQSTVAKIEWMKGKSTSPRHVTVDEAFVLAAALNVPPPLLFTPLGEHDRLRVTSRSEIHPHLALDWIAGDGPLVTTSRHAIEPSEWRKAAAPLTLFRQLRPLQQAVHAAEASVERAAFLEDPDLLRDAKAALVRSLEDLVQHRDQIQAAELQPPKLPPSWQRMIDQLGLEEGS